MSSATAKKPAAGKKKPVAEVQVDTTPAIKAALGSIKPMEALPPPTGRPIRPPLKNPRLAKQ